MKRTIRKLLCLALTLTLVFGALAVTASAEADDLILYVKGDHVAYTNMNVLSMELGGEKWIRVERGGEPVELAERFFAMDAAVDPTPVREDGHDWYRLHLTDGAVEGAITTIAIQNENGIAMLSSIVVVPHNPCVAKTPDGTTYKDGETVRIKPGETTMLTFALTNGDTIPSSAWSMEAVKVLIPGWFKESLTEAGFTVQEEPEFINGLSYAVVSAEGLAPGTTGTLSYHFVMLDQVFGDHPVGWQDAATIYQGTVNFLVTNPDGSDPGETSDGTRGDANLDGKVLANDARLVLRASAKLETLEGQGFINCDLNGDGKLLAGEARKILRYSAKLEQVI